MHLFNREAELRFEEIAVHGDLKFAALQLGETLRDAETQPAALAACAGGVSADEPLAELCAGFLQRLCGDVPEGDGGDAVFSYCDTEWRITPCETFLLI